MASDLQTVANAHRPMLGLIPGVTGVGIGAKYRRCQKTGEKAIIVYVRKKLPADEVPADQLIPAELDGFKTDVFQSGVESDEAAAADVELFIDRRRFREDEGGIHGGMQIFIPGPGTLGCMLTRQVPEGTEVLALTNAHIANVLSFNPPLTIRQKAEQVGNEAGQPDKGSSGFFCCCSNVIGKVVGARYDEVVDGAVVRLDSGLPWAADVEDVGAVKGSRTITVDDLLAEEMVVVKRGRTTLKTRGIVIDVDKPGDVKKDGVTVRHYEHNIHVLPLPPFRRFSNGGDSGSVYLDRQNRVIALHATGIDNGLDDAPTGTASSAGAPIAAVLAAFDATVATATAPGQVQTVPELSGSAQLAQSPRTRRPLASAPELVSARNAFSRSETGRRYLAVLTKHQGEVDHLIRERARVAAIWKSRKGAALASRVLSAPFRPDDPIFLGLPPELVRQNINDILDVLDRYGSDVLRDDIAALRPVLGRWADLSLHDVIGELDREAASAALAEKGDNRAYLEG